MNKNKPSLILAYFTISEYNIGYFAYYRKFFKYLSYSFEEEAVFLEYDIDLYNADS